MVPPRPRLRLSLCHLSFVGRMGLCMYLRELQLNLRSAKDQRGSRLHVEVHVRRLEHAVGPEGDLTCGNVDDLPITSSKGARKNGVGREHATRKGGRRLSKRSRRAVQNDWGLLPCLPSKNLWNFQDAREWLLVCTLAPGGVGIFVVHTLFAVHNSSRLLSAAKSGLFLFLACTYYIV